MLLLVHILIWDKTKSQINEYSDLAWHALSTMTSSNMSFDSGTPLFEYHRLGIMKTWVILCASSWTHDLAEFDAKALQITLLDQMFYLV